MKTKIIALALCLIVTGYGYAAAQNQEPKKGKSEEEIEVVPDSTSPDVLPGKLRMKRRDGVVELHGSGTHRPEEGPKGWHVEVDEKKGTYRATPVPPGTDLQDLLPGPPIIEHKGVPQQIPSPDRESKAGGIRPASWSLKPVVWNPGNWWGAVAVIGIDPARIRVTAIKSQLAWWVANWGNIGINWYSDEVSAANPTIVGTHWYVTSTTDYGWWWEYWSGWEPCHTFYAAFVNYDFPPYILPPRYNNPTTLEHKAKICGRTDGVYDWWWWYWKWGPYSALLSAYVLLW